jgi:hypothetical protein
MHNLSTNFLLRATSDAGCGSVSATHGSEDRECPLGSLLVASEHRDEGSDTPHQRRHQTRQAQQGGEASDEWRRQGLKESLD